MFQIIIYISFRENLIFIKERMAQLAPQNIALRLICLLSQCSDGISSSDFTTLKQQFVQVINLSIDFCNSSVHL